MEELLLENKELDQNIEYPWIVFKSGEELYSFSSRQISAIMNLPEEITKTPQSAYHTRGIISYRGSSIPLIDLRVLFGKESLADEINDFKQMLEDRKNDHLTWVNKFEDSALNDTEITVGSDCKACAFGKWYYSFKSGSNHVMHSLAKIEEPHCLLHNCVNELVESRKLVDSEERKKTVSSILSRVKDNYCKNVVKNIDDSFEALKDSYRELVLVVETANPIGIIVDNVLGVENLKFVADKEKLAQYNLTNYMIGVANNKDGIVVLLDENIIVDNVLNH